MDDRKHYKEDKLEIEDDSDDDLKMDEDLEDD